MSGKVSIESLDGVVPLHTIKKGDMVLTHRGRFRKVTEVIRRQIPKGSEYVTIDFHVDADIESGSRSESYASFAVTFDHPVLTKRGWVKAGELVEGDVVKVRAEKCVDCGEPTPYNNFISKSRKNPICAECRNKRLRANMRETCADPDFRARRSATLKEVFNRPEMKAQSSRITKAQMKREDRLNNWPIEKRRACTANLRKKLKESGWHKKLIELGCNARMKKPSKLQYRLFKFMQYNFGDEVTLEHKVDIPTANYRFIDVAFPSYKIGVEYDGEYWHQDEAADRARDKELESAGWMIIHTRDGNDFKNVLRQVRRLMQNHDGEYLFVPARVSKLIRKKVSRAWGVFNLSVEDDNSFIAKGVAVHNCRGSFNPVVSFKDWDEFMPPPESVFEDVRSVEVGDSIVEGVPLDFASDIEDSLEVNELSLSVGIVPDIVDTNQWIEDERNRILDEMGGGTPLSDIRLDMMVEESRADQRGQISMYESDDGELLVSGFSFYNDDPDWFVTRRKGQEVYDSLGVDSLGIIQEMYDAKVSEAEFTINDDGLEIIGSPVADTIAGFITPAAGQDAKSYFVESYTLYQTDEFKLEFLDPGMHRFIQELGVVS